MRRGLNLLLLIILIILFSGCTSSNSSRSTDSATNNSTNPSNSITPENSKDNANKQPVTISLAWLPVPDNAMKAWKDYLLDPFQKENPNIKVDFRVVPNAFDVVKVQIASGEGPDFFIADAFDLKNQVDAGMLLPLDNYVKQYGWDKIVFPWALRAGQVNGKQYGVPKAVETSHLIYNKDLLDKYNWPIPKTRAEFEMVCAAAMKQGLTPIAYGDASLPLLNPWLYDHYLDSYAGPAPEKALFKGQKKFTDPDIRGAFDLLVKDWQRGWINNKNSAGVTVDDARNLFYNQKAVFLTEGSWFTDQLASDVIKFNFGITKWPSMKDGMPAASGIGHGKAIAVNKNSKHPDEVAKFLDFMYTHKELGAEGAVHGLQPLPVDTPADMFPSAGNASVMKMLNATMDAVKDPNSGYLPWTFFPAKTNQFLYENLDALFYGKMTLDEYLNKAQQLLDSELKDGFEFAAD